MKYNPEETLNHVIASEFDSCLINLNTLIKEEGCTDSREDLFRNINVINLDCVEDRIASRDRRDKNSTMDCSFAISDEEIVNMLLVEFRFNYKSLANLRAGKLRDKVSGSSNVLGESPTIHNFYIFAFNNDLIQQAKSRFSRLNPRIPNNYIVMNIYELNNVYFE